MTCRELPLHVKVATRVAQTGWAGVFRGPADAPHFYERAIGWLTLDTPQGKAIAELYVAAAHEHGAGLNPCR